MADCVRGPEGHLGGDRRRSELELPRFLLGLYAEISVKRIDARLVLAERSVAPGLIC